MKAIDFIRALPKAELHLHLEGALPWAMVRAASPNHLPETPVWWANGFRFDDFTHFKKAIAICYRDILTSLENYHRAAQAVFQNLAAQNVRYVEISFSLEWAITQKLRLADVVASIKRAAPPGLSVSVIGGLSREEAHLLTDDVLEAVFRTPTLDGLDLHGDERVCGSAPFADIFRHARQSGLRTKAHAGELVGPHSIADTLDLLQVKRIEHGTTAIRDKALMARLAEERITLDMCPWSNVRLRVVEHITDHPIREFHRRGIPVTINTDDPTVFGYSLTDEMLSLVENLRFTLPELAALQINAFRVADIPPATRQTLQAEIEQLLRDC